jgi:hypothetical protein
MSAAARKIDKGSPTTFKPASRPTPVDVFTLRCWARAELWAAGELDLPEAVDALQAAAVASELVDRLGQDAVQEIISKAFGVVR